MKKAFYSSNSKPKNKFNILKYNNSYKYKYLNQVSQLVFKAWSDKDIKND